MMRSGKRFRFGDVVITEVQFTDTFEIKRRPAVVLFEELGNVVAVVVTSNPNMKGISLTKKEGMKVNSVIKLNYIFTISENMVVKILFSVSEEKKKLIKKILVEKIA